MHYTYKLFRQRCVYETCRWGWEASATENVDYVECWVFCDFGNADNIIAAFEDSIVDEVEKGSKRHQTDLFEPQGNLSLKIKFVLESVVPRIRLQKAFIILVS